MPLECVSAARSTLKRGGDANSPMEGNLDASRCPNPGFVERAPLTGGVGGGGRVTGVIYGAT